MFNSVAKIRSFLVHSDSSVKEINNQATAYEAGYEKIDLHVAHGSGKSSAWAAAQGKVHFAEQRMLSDCISVCPNRFQRPVSETERANIQEALSRIQQHYPVPSSPSEYLDQATNNEAMLLRHQAPLGVRRSPINARIALPVVVRVSKG